MSRIISGRKFLLHLIEAGIVPDETVRVVIDAHCEKVLRLYYEVIGSDKLIEVVTPESLKDAIKINVTEKTKYEADAGG